MPVPNLRWLELDASQIGAPFFAMDRVAGRVPPDIMPYPMGRWLSEASRADQRHLQDATIATIARLHTIDPNKSSASFLEFPVPGATPLRRHVESQRRFYDWVRQERRYPLLERAFAWIDAHWPEPEGDTVISWGDSRIGNILYNGFTPVAVLDWEMAALGPREIDLGWLVFLHAFFEMIARAAGLPGMPDFLRARDVVATYERASSKRVGDLRWYETYVALRHGIVMVRIHSRMLHFDEATRPAERVRNYYRRFRGSHRRMQLIEELPQPLIVALHGYCLGAGFEVAMLGDIRLAAETTTFGAPEVQIGVAIDGGARHAPGRRGRSRLGEVDYLQWPALRCRQGAGHRPGAGGLPGSGAARRRPPPRRGNRRQRATGRAGDQAHHQHVGQARPHRCAQVRGDEHSDLLRLRRSA